jgi:hypothetical protein
MTTLPLMLRSMLLWLTLLAFPGLAAAAAQPCALHGHAAAPAGPTAATALRTAPQVHARMPSAVTHAHDAAPSPAACHDDGGAGGGGSRHGKHARCSACPACCAGVAPAPAFMPAPRGPGAAFVAVPFLPGHLPSVDPFLLERPPRPAFA